MPPKTQQFQPIPCPKCAQPGGRLDGTVRLVCPACAAANEEAANVAAMVHMMLDPKPEADGPSEEPINPAEPTADGWRLLYQETSRIAHQYRQQIAELQQQLEAARGQVAAQRRRLVYVADYARAHHEGQAVHLLVHSLRVDIPSICLSDLP